MRERFDVLQLSYETEARRAEAAEAALADAAEHAAETEAAEKAAVVTDAPATVQKPRIRITYTHGSDSDGSEA